MATAAKFPAALLALADVFGEMPNFPQLTLNGSINASVTSIVVNESIPSTWPQVMWITIDSEILHVTSWATKTFTVAARDGSAGNAQSTTAATHADKAYVTPALTAQQWNQVVADLIGVETKLAKNFMTRQAVTITAGNETVDLASGDYVVLTMNASWATPTISNPTDGHVYVFEIVQDATGSRTITWPAAFTFTGSKTLTTTASAVDVVTAIYNGGSSKYRAALNTNYA